MYHPFRSLPDTHENSINRSPLNEKEVDITNKNMAEVAGAEPVPESALSNKEQPVKPDLSESAQPPLDVDRVKPTTPLPEAAPPRTASPSGDESTNPQESTPIATAKKSENLVKKREIKSNKSDLKIVIAGGEEGEEETRWYQSATMAEHSVYIDNTIESLMTENVGKPYEIRFEDIDETTWELMMKFLDPVESRDMMAKDVLVVGEFYDRYDFPQGRKLCDKVLQEYFMSERNNEAEMDVEMLVDAVALAYKAHLLKSYEIGQRFVKEKLSSYKDNSYSRPTVAALPIQVESSEMGTPSSKTRKSRFGLK